MIYGDMFSSDTRALIAVCKYANITHEYKPVNSLKKENLELEYSQLNPTKQIPMIIDGHNKVIGSAGILQDWILRTKEDAARVFEHSSQENEAIAM